MNFIYCYYYCCHCYHDPHHQWQHPQQNHLKGIRQSYEIVPELAALIIVSIVK